MPTFPELKAEFKLFDVLPVSEDTSEKRKAIVRSVETHVRNQMIALTEAQFRECRDGDAALGRILAYLFAEHERIKTGLADRRSYVVAEWERLQHDRFASGTSTMPVYYAVRSYLTCLKNTPESAGAAQADQKLFEQIDQVLSSTGMDPGGQVRRGVAEITSIIVKSKESQSQSSPAVVAARLSRKGAIIAAIIVTIGALIVGLLANWDKLVNSEPKQNRQEPVPALTGNTAASPDMHDLLRFGTIMPFHTGWIFVGYYDEERGTYIEGPYAAVAFRPTGGERGLLKPALGDVLQMKKNRRVIIANYRTEGLKNQLTSPPLIHDPLTADDETGVTLPAGQLLIVRHVEVSGYRDRPVSVWCRVAECDSHTDGCKKAAVELQWK